MSGCGQFGRMLVAMTQHEHLRSKIVLMNIQTSKCDLYQEKFLLTERDISNTIGSLCACSVKL